MAASDYAQERLLKFSLAWSGASTDGSGFVVCEPGGGRQGVLGGVQDQVPIIFLARMNVAKGYRNILFAHAQKSANANDQGADITGLVDKNVIDVADLIVGGIIDILLVKVGHGGPGGQSGEDLTPIASTVAAVAEMIFLMFCSLLRGWSGGAATLDVGPLRSRTCRPATLPLIQIKGTAVAPVLLMQRNI
jgi:hypothetical protein